MRGMFRVSEIVFAEGCLPCVVPSRAAAPSSHQHSWSRPKSVHGKEPFRIRCGNEPRWFCFCINNRWCPTLRPRNGYSCICGRCNGGAAGGPRGTFPWKTSQDGAVRRLFLHLDPALVKGLACELVAETQQPLSRQSLADITARACKALGKPISRSTVWRMLDTDAIKPWRYKYWIVPRDPHFAEKAGPMLDLYAGMWPGQALGPKDHIHSADEKTSIQARRRCHPSVSPALGRPSRIEHEYERVGSAPP
jgi:hypothetical protein